MAAREEWRLCADWLVRCKILAPDHRVIQPYAEVFDLAQTLRDGVLICHLLNTLKPGSVDLKDFSQRPQMSQFLCLKNIRTFLCTCRTEFKLKESDLFDAYDLFEVKDFGKVIQTLSKLSKCPDAEATGITGFPPTSAGANYSSNKDIYRSLGEIADHRGIDDEPIYDFQTDDDDAEDIYGEILYPRGPAKRRPSQPVASPLSQPQTKREYCIKEMVETEKNYVDALNMIIVHFIHPMTKSGLISPQDLKVMFLLLEKLHVVHTGFHSELLKACKNIGTTTISDCFIKYKKEFLVYGDFCSNLSKAQEMVDQLSTRDPKIAEKIKECQTRANDGRFRLRDLLSVPMQRVLKYHLLLKELIKQTEKSDGTYKNLERALEAMQDLSLYVNEVKRDNEALQLIHEIQESITDLQMPENTSLKDYGRLLKDGELKVESHEDNRKHIRYIFLFDKVMLMCKSRMVDRFLWGETYSYKNALILADHFVEDGPNSASKVRDAKSKLWTNHFLLWERTTRTKAYSFYAKTEDMRRKWIEAINMALENTCPPDAKKGNHNFVMFSFNEPTTCSFCGKLLRGVFYQGYKCQITDKCVHKECIPKVNLPQTDNPPGPGTTPRPLPIRRPDRDVMGKKVKARMAYVGTPHPANGQPILVFEEGDVIDLLKDDGDQWYEGRLKGKEGVFPKNFVELHRMKGRTNSYTRPELQTPVPASPIEAARNGHVPPIHSPSAASSAGYVNIGSNPASMDQEPWFVGDMSREIASQRLEKHPSGAYLIRTSVTNVRKGEYSLSIKYNTSVKHIKVMQTSEHMFYLADCKLFRSLPELVEYYQQHTLKYSFPELDTILLLPYKTSVQQLQSSQMRSGPQILGHCTAMFDYMANQPNQLSLQKGDKVAIVSKAGGFRGWWKGQLHSKVGYFPSAYVVEDDE